ncbi:hypothetical protein Tco_1278132, partial [Tanacetum coccineum]
AYRLKLPQQLSRVHSKFHVSNLKKCLSDEPLAVPLDEIHIDDKIRFVKEPVEIMDCEVKRLKESFPEEVSATLHKNRTLDRCRILHLANKAPLTGEDCNNLLFQTSIWGRGDSDEDPEEDHADYPGDEGDGGDEPSNDDDDDDDTDDEDEEHLAPAYGGGGGETFLLYMGTLGYRAAGIRIRAASPPSLLPSTSHRTDILESEMPPRKRACLTTLAPGLKIGESSAAGAVR